MLIDTKIVPMLRSSAEFAPCLEHGDAADFLTKFGTIYAIQAA